MFVFFFTNCCITKIQVHGREYFNPINYCRVLYVHKDPRLFISHTNIRMLWSHRSLVFYASPVWRLSIPQQTTHYIVIPTILDNEKCPTIPTSLVYVLISWRRYAPFKKKVLCNWRLTPRSTTKLHLINLSPRWFHMWTKSLLSRSTFRKLWGYQS